MEFMEVEGPDCKGAGEGYALEIYNCSQQNDVSNIATVKQSIQLFLLPLIHTLKIQSPGEKNTPSVNVRSYTYCIETEERGMLQIFHLYRLRHTEATILPTNTQNEGEVVVAQSLS